MDQAFTPEQEKEAYEELYKEAYEELYKEAIALKARMGMERRATKGIQHGAAPLGYKNVVVNGEKVIVPDPETAPKVKRLFELSTNKGMTIRKLVPLAAEMGLRSRSGKPLGPSSIHAILKNPFYEGSIRCRDFRFRGVHCSIILND